MSELAVDRCAAKRTDDQRYKKEVEVLGEAAHFLASAAAELELMRLELALLMAAVECRSGASPGESRRQMVLNDRFRKRSLVDMKLKNLSRLSRLLSFKKYLAFVLNNI